LKIRCPNCGVEGDIPDGQAERRIRCPECEEVFTVAEAGESEAGAPDPGAVPVRRSRRARSPRPRHGRTFQLGRAISSSFEVWGTNFVPFTLLALVIYSPLLLFFLVSGGFEDAGVWSIVLAIVASFFLPRLLVATVIYGSFQRLRRQPMSIAESVSRGLACLPRVVVVFLLSVVIYAAALVPGILCALVSAGSFAGGVAATGVLFGFLAFVLLILGLSYPWTTLVCAVPAAVVEHAGPVEAIRRSFELTKGDRLTVFGVLFLVSILVGLIVGVLGEIVALFVSERYVGFASQLVQAPFQAITAVLAAVIYHDLRVAREGIGTDELAKIFE